MIMKTTRFTSLSLALLFALVLRASGQGPLTPPGPPSPVLKTLNQIEPRTDVFTLPGNGNNQFLITQSGSYYLTTNLVGVASKNGISIQADNVTLDLGGFAMLGGVATAQQAILVSGAHMGLLVRNGAISGWPGNGISGATATESQFQSLRLMTNGGYGLKLGSGNKISDCLAMGNLSDGFNLGSNCTVTASEADYNFDGIEAGNGAAILNSRAQNNTAYGILANQNSLVTGCVGNGNGDYGVYTFDGCTVKDCTTGTNEIGILIANGCTVKDCTADYNYGGGFETGNDCTVAGCTASFDGDGFLVSSECTIINCTACANYVTGIAAFYSCLIKDNTTASNGRYSGISGAEGIEVEDSGNRIEGNLSNSDGIGIAAFGTENIVIHNTVRSAGSYNYDIYSGNMVGPIVYPPASGAIQGLTGGSGLGTTDPYANFSF